MGRSPPAQDDEDKIERPDELWFRSRLWFL